MSRFLPIRMLMMSRNPYQVLGDRIPAMLGREQLHAGLCRHLTKATPDHVCVVGHTLFGKSVLLNHLAGEFREGNEHYVTSLYWDLRHGTPRSDDEFRRRFSERVKDALHQVKPELADCLELEDPSLRDLLHLVFEDMERDKIRLLAVLDGFDHVLSWSEITRNLWDDMRALGQRSSLRLVTGSRRPLRELCKSEDSRTSDFWEIFYDSPLNVGRFDDTDWVGFLAPFKLRAIAIDGSAPKELVNWTGGVPVLAAAMAARLYEESGDGGTISKSDVDTIGEAAAEERRQLLEALWADCTIEVQSELVALSNGDLGLSEVSEVRRRDLESRGFARASGNKLRSSCRLMADYAREQGSEVQGLRRLFGTADRFEQNIRGLLELRLAQMRGSDPELLGYVESAVRDLHPDPLKSVVWVRTITERALNLIWAAELPPDRTIPGEWANEWKHSGQALSWLDDRRRLPPRSGAQCNVLRLMTGTEQVRRVARFVTKPTYLFVDHLQSVGDFGQHRRDEVTLQAATAFCMSAIALCESLTRDLATPRP
jgi:hypothetical protein